MTKLDEVFGISIKPVRSYVERQNVDQEFKSALEGHHHLVIYGSSKQGKTSLRQKHLSDDQCTVIRCSVNTTPETVYQAILRDAGVRIEAFETKSDTIGGSAKAKWGFKAFLPWVASTDASGEAGIKAEQQTTLQSEFIGYDLADGQAITELLAECKFNKFVVIENFHYLPEEVQQALAFDLKTFHEVGVRFIILGIWREANFLLVHNYDLEGRIIEIPVEPWIDEDFDRVIDKGSAELNVIVPGSTKSDFKQNAYGNIGMLQEFLKTFCRLNDISQRCEIATTLENGKNTECTFARKLETQRGRLLKVLEGIAGKSRTDSDDPLILPYYLVQVLLSTPIAELEAGIRRQDLLDKIRAIHHREAKDTVRGSDISHLLKRLPSHQQDMHPPFVHYDSNQQRLKIVDTSQFFSLSRLDRDILREEIQNPIAIFD